MEKTCISSRHASTFQSRFDSETLRIYELLRRLVIAIVYDGTDLQRFSSSMKMGKHSGISKPKRQCTHRMRTRVHHCHEYAIWFSTCVLLCMPVPLFSVLEWHVRAIDFWVLQFDALPLTTLKQLRVRQRKLHVCLRLWRCQCHFLTQISNWPDEHSTWHHSCDTLIFYQVFEARRSADAVLRHCASIWLTLQTELGTLEANRLHGRPG